jgi:hypothetical protein
MNSLLVIDNFLPDPDMVRRYALSVNYFDNIKENYTYFPGKRTNVMAKMNPEYNASIFNKFSKLLYNVDEAVYSIDIKSYFQIVYEKYRRGWVHSDNGEIDLAGVLYLTPNPPADSGTEFYKEKSVDKNKTIINIDIKQQFVTNQIEFDAAKEALLENNLQYELTDYISNKYNRLILYPASWYHCARNYFGDTDENARLTQVFFIKCISHNAEHKYFLDKIRITK